MSNDRRLPAWPEEDAVPVRRPAPLLLRSSPRRRVRRTMQRGTLYLRECRPQNIRYVFWGWGIGVAAIVLFSVLVSLLGVLNQLISVFF